MKFIDTITNHYQRDHNVVIPFVNLVQTHLYNTPGCKLREPTNEELNLMVNLSLTYGAKSELYFWYGGWGDIPSESYGRGLVEDDTLRTPRYTNVYGEAKWDTIKAINKRLKKWGPYLMSFDNLNRHSCRFYDENERNVFVSNSYFSDIRTYAPDISDPDIPINPEEIYPNRYLQVATFQPINSNPKYFASSSSSA
jgi:hypothetical protein